MPKTEQLRFFNQKIVFEKIKNEFDTLIKDSASKIGIKLSLVLLCLILIIFTASWIKLPPEIPLFYSKPWGQDRLISKAWFFSLPGMALLITLINLKLASVSFKKEPLLSQILIWSTVVSLLLAIISLIKILLLIL